MHPCRQDDITSNPELLDIIGALRGAAMIDDEDDTSESKSEDNESDLEIQEITALEHFASTLQQAHDLAAASEQEQEKG